MPSKKNNPEKSRLEESGDNPWHKWKRWGLYVSDRSWGTVREDYSKDGNAWSYFPFQDSHARAYRWGEDGIAGLCDRYQILVFSPSFWNHNDPILKERLFGLTTWEGNHGEDVKEYYFHLDALPTFSYVKYLYKYPQVAFPYEKLYEENKKRDQKELEYELIDTGLFDEDRYFDIFIEYAKASPEDICMKIEICNRGDQPAPIDLLGELRFRNQWSWDDSISQPEIREEGDAIVADDSRMQSPKRLLFDYHLQKRYLYCSEKGERLFTHNETNREKVYNEKNDTPYVKDAFHNYVVSGEKNAVNLKKVGTKAAWHLSLEEIPAKSSKIL